MESGLWWDSKSQSAVKIAMESRKEGTQWRSQMPLHEA